MTGPPVVAVVGRPNVGKSSLVNRILGQREAIVDATPGVTRDRRGFDAEWSGRRFELLDTGGLEPGGEGLEARVVEQAHLALDAADVVVLVVDGTAGILEDDSRVADLLRRSGKPVVVAVNKLDDPVDESLAARFYRLGLGDPHPVSALHGRGSGDLLDAVVARLPAEPEPSAPEWASVGIVGRPNVGKSSLLNALVGVERAIVDAAPGTTRDPVDARLALPDGRSLRLADTAGMRRGVQIKDPIEYFSWLRSRRTLERVDAVVLVVDAAAGVTGHDQRIAEEIVSAGRACVVALNKWDRLPADEVERGRLERAIDDRLRFLEWAPVVRTSAITGRGVGRLAPAVTGAVEAHRHRIPTPRVNDLVRDAQERRPPPRARGRAVRVLYGVQAAVAPPTFVLFATGALEPSYLRYVERRIRSAHPFAGSPIRVMGRVRARGTVPA